AHLRHQQRRRQHPRHRPGQQQGGAGDRGHRGGARHRLLARWKARLRQQRVRHHARRVRRGQRPPRRESEALRAPNNIATTKDGGRVVVGIAEEPGALDVIDTKTLKVAKSIPVNGRLHNVYVTPDNKYAVTGSIRTKVLTVIDLATETIAWELKLDQGVRP